MIQKTTAFDLKSQDFFIEVINHASFNAYFTVSYSYNNSNFSFNSPILASTDLDKLVIAPKATNIVVTVYIVTQTGATNTLYTKTYPTPTTLKLLLTGTETAPVYTDIGNSTAPVPVPPVNYYISLTNTASFIGKLYVKYTLNKKIFSDDSDSILINQTTTLRIPGAATNIQIAVKIKDKVTPWTSIYTNTLAIAKTLKLSLSGTISSPVCTDITSQNDSGNIPILPDVAVTILNSGDFTAQFSLNYDLSDYNVTSLSNNIVNGKSISIPLPSDATNIQLDIELMDVDGSWFSIYQDFFNTPSKLILKLTGTLSSSEVTDITNNPPPVGNSGIPVMELNKTPDKTMYNVGDTVRFTIQISNTEGGTASNVVLTDNIPSGSIFLPNSLTLDGYIIYADDFINNGLIIGDMNLGDTHTVNYEIVVSILPYPNPVKNDPVINYDYVDTNGSNQIGTLTGETIPFTVLSNGNNTNPTMELTKTPDKTMYNVGDTVRFTIEISNTEGETASNVVLTDNIPNEATFIKTSLTLDSISVNGDNFIDNGLNLGDINVGDSHTVTYQMTINSMPNANPVKNDPVVNYDYVDSSGANSIGTFTGEATPFTVVQNECINCCCCCCCPCMCNCGQSSANLSNFNYDEKYIEYLKSLGYM